MATLLNWLQTTTADFVAGTCGSQILDTSGDELKLLPQSTITQFNNGTYNNTGSGIDISNDFLRLGITGIPNGSFEYNGGWDVCDDAKVKTGARYVHSGSYGVNLSRVQGGTGSVTGELKIQIIAGNGTVYETKTIELPALGLWYKIVAYDLTPYAGKLIKVVFSSYLTGNSQSSQGAIYSPLFIPKSATLYFWLRYLKGGSDPSDIYTISIDDLEGQECQLTGNFLSQTLDYANAPASFGHLTYKSTEPSDTTITFKTQSSANGTDWDAEVALGAGGTIDSTEKRYLRWKAYFTRTDDGKAIPYLESVYCGGMEWYSAKYNIGRLDSYQTFLSTYNKYTETLIISYRTARSSAELDTATWYLIDNNEVPVNGLKGLDIWIQLKVRFNTDTFANQPVLYDTKIQWYDMIDKGLRYGKDGISYPIGCMENPLGCKLRIRRNDVTNGVVLVDTTDPKASPIRIYINGQTKALAKYS